jgi:hypothetical protein
MLLAATSLVAAACTATSHHDGSRASIDHDLTRAALGNDHEPSTTARDRHAPPSDAPLGSDSAVAFAIANNPSFRAEVLAAHEAALAVDAVALGPTPMVMLEVGVPISDMASVPVLALLTASLTDLVTRDDRMEAASLRDWLGWLRSRRRVTEAQLLVAGRSATLLSSAPEWTWTLPFARVDADFAKEHDAHRIVVGGFAGHAEIAFLLGLGLSANRRVSFCCCC